MEIALAILPLIDVDRQLLFIQNLRNIYTRLPIVLRRAAPSWQSFIHSLICVCFMLIYLLHFAHCLQPPPAFIKLKVSQLRMPAKVRLP